jgi:hypothetical protein
MQIENNQYKTLIDQIGEILTAGRQRAVQSVNTILVLT